MDVYITGSVETVLKGEVSKSTLFPVYSHECMYGLGAGAISPSLIGEAIAYDASFHTFTKEKKLKTKEPRLSPFFMGIPTRPRNRFKTKKRQTISALYKEILSLYPKGFVLTGEGTFASLALCYLKQSPTLKENILEHKEKYWGHETLSNLTVKVFAVVHPGNEPRAFYHNPLDTSDLKAHSHSHVLTTGARHLLETSTLLSGEFYIEEIHCFSLFHR